MTSITNFLKPYLDKLRAVFAEKVDMAPTSISLDELKIQLEKDRQHLRDCFDNDLINEVEFYDGLNKLKVREEDLKPKYQKYADALIFNGEGKILLLRRSITDTFCPDCWSLPGGKIENGEEPWYAAMREVKEETGLDVCDGSPVYVKNIDNGEIHYFMYSINDLPNIILDNDEHINWKFLSLEEMKDLPLILDLEETINNILNPPIDITKAEGGKWGSKQALKELAGHAKKTSHENLERVIKEHPDPVIRVHAHKEIARREEEEGNSDSLKGYKAHEYHGKEFKYEKESDSYVDEEGSVANKGKLHEYNTMKHAELTHDLESINKELSESTKQRDGLKNKLVKEFYIKMKKFKFPGTSTRAEANDISKVKFEKMGLSEEDIDLEKLNKILDRKFKEKII